MSDKFETPLYFILGVSSSATDQEVEAAYKMLSRRYHPDLSTEPDAEKKYKEINWAYAVLSRGQVARDEYHTESKARIAAGMRQMGETDMTWLHDVRDRLAQDHANTLAMPPPPHRPWWRRITGPA